MQQEVWLSVLEKVRGQWANKLQAEAVLIAAHPERNLNWLPKAGQGEIFDNVNLLSP
jgi:hypothetical protein